MEQAGVSYAHMPRAMERGVGKHGWRIIGPGGGGAQYIPTIQPGAPDTALVACDMTGSYITRDGGKTWRQFNLEVWVRALAFDPSNANTVYAGATGLYRSEDAGEKWRLVFPNPAAVAREKTVGDHADHSYVSTDNWPGGRVEAICVDPGDSQRIFIGVNCGALKMFFSSDYGESWAECGQLEGSRFIKSYMDPTSPAQDRTLLVLADTGLYRLTLADGADEYIRGVERVAVPSHTGVFDLACGLDQATEKPLLYITTPTAWENGAFVPGVYRSADLGNTWEPLATGLDADLRPTQTRRLTCIATCPADANVVYVAAAEPATSSDAETFGIFKSTDKGNSWQWALRIGRTNPGNRTLGWVEKDYSTEWGGAPFSLGVSPENPEVCYATDWGTSYRTINGGATWEQLYCHVYPDGSVSTRGLDVTNIYSICFDPFDKNHVVLACTDVGVFHSRNGGKSWSHALSGVPQSWSNTCYAIAFDPDVRGRAWSAWSNCHDMPRPKMFRTGHFNRYEGGVCKSDDGMASWQRSNAGMLAQCVPTDIILDRRSPVGRRTLYVAAVGKGVFKSTDDGHTWQAKNQGITSSLNAWRIILRPDGSLYLLVCRGLENGQVISGAVFKSADGAEYWEPVPMPAGANFPNDLAFDPSNPERLYLACWPTVIDDAERCGGLYKTEDGGQSWTNVFDESSHVYGVAVDRTNPATVFLANFEGAVYRSDDRGRTWERLGGYNFKWAKQPILDPYNRDMLYITTFGSSVWYGPARGVAGAFEDICPLR